MIWLFELVNNNKQGFLYYLKLIFRGRWSSAKTQDSGSRGLGFETSPDLSDFSELKIRPTFAPLHPGV